MTDNTWSRHLKTLSSITCLEDRHNKLERLKDQIEREEKIRAQDEAVRRRDRRMLWGRSLCD